MFANGLSGGNALRLLVMAGFALSIFVGSGCAPKYPECNSDEQCKDRGEYCVNKICRPCADDSHCSANDACKFCGESFSCERVAGCCQSDLDCPGGKCYTEGSTLGQCGPKCRGNGDCPPGNICKNGQCVPDVECNSNADCPPGKSCINGVCVLKECQPETVYFDFDDATIRRDMKPVLESGADCIKQRNKSVVVEGHCDDRGSDEYNMALGQRRARAAKKYLGRLGIGQSVRTISYGEERPTCSSQNEGCWSSNRRTEFSFE